MSYKVKVGGRKGGGIPPGGAKSVIILAPALFEKETFA